MSYRDGHFQDLKVPLTWTVAVAVVVAAVIAIALLISDRRETFRASAYSAARAVADAVNMPMGEVMAAPGRMAGQAGDYLKDYFFAASENRRLRQEVADLKRLRDDDVALRNINERYKALLGFRTDPPVPMVAARVVLDARGPFSDTRLADVGKEHGVEIGNPVMSDRGLIGRVVGVTRGASRILLLTDVASRVPVLIDRTNARAILTGDASSAPKLEYLRGQNPVRNGDRILTSGDGGLAPRGLPVGTAVKGFDGAWRVQLDADETSIDFVRIMLFTDFAKLVDQKELSAISLPPGPAANGRPQAVTMAAPGAPPSASPAPAANPVAPAKPSPRRALSPKTASPPPSAASVSADAPPPQGPAP
ncbi:MAG TPA: rod shape-determining protein MreC [Caulobacteraceae bacterium]|nr:rod shape-determining protein MreC [Caulobacteraceae bacterium]